jgi:hypothetical protein
MYIEDGGGNGGSSGITDDIYIVILVFCLE